MLQGNTQERKTAGRPVTKENSRPRKVSEPDDDVRNELSLTHMQSKQ